MNIVLNEVRTAPEKTDGQLMPLSRYILGARGQTGNKPASSHAGLQPFISADLQRPSFFRGRFVAAAAGATAVKRLSQDTFSIRVGSRQVKV